MNAEHKVEFDFGNAPKDGEAAAPVDFTGKEPLGKCPKCGANVFDGGMNYVCEKQTGPTPTCDFRSGKIILQQEISPEQVKKLLAEGKTDLLERFHLEEKQPQVRGVFDCEGRQDGVRVSAARRQRPHEVQRAAAEN